MWQLEDDDLIVETSYCICFAQVKCFTVENGVFHSFGFFEVSTSVALLRDFYRTKAPFHFWCNSN